MNNNIVTKNRPQTSVIADAYVTQPGKRSVTINAAVKRPLASVFSSPEFPTDALKTLAYEAKNVLMQVFKNEKIKDSYQSVFYVSNISYTFDSDNNISLTAELTYTYKAPPPF